MYTVNAVVELAVYVFSENIRRINETQELLPRLRMDPEINAEKTRYGDLASGFLQRFANDGFLGGLAGFNMTAGLRDYYNSGGTLLDHEETVVLFNNSGYCQISRQHGVDSWS